MLGVVLGSVGKGILAKELAKTVKAIEARGDSTRAPDPGPA
jgi:hypothetical protein